MTDQNLSNLSNLILSGAELSYDAHRAENDERSYIVAQTLKDILS